MLCAGLMGVPCMGGGVGLAVLCMQLRNLRGGVEASALKGPVHFTADGCFVKTGLACSVCLCCLQSMLPACMQTKNVSCCKSASSTVIVGSDLVYVVPRCASKAGFVCGVAQGFHMLVSYQQYL
jgi:hypothetical protein